MTMSGLFWRFADPLLTRARSRIEHLESLSPSDRRQREMRTLGSIANSAMIAPEAFFTNVATRDQLVVGEHASIRGEVRVLMPTARISIGHHTYIGPSTRIWAKESITIGNFVLISHVVDVIDNNSHSLDWNDRRQDLVNLLERRVEIDYTRIESAPVVIEDDVWIGAKATILKGVRIGRGAVIGAASVVMQDVAPFTLVAGNPLRVIRELPRD